MLLLYPFPPEDAFNPDAAPSRPPVPPVEAVPPEPLPVPPGVEVFVQLEDPLHELFAQCVWPPMPPLPVNVFVLHETLDASPLPPSRKGENVFALSVVEPARPPAPTITVSSDEDVAATRSA